MRKFGIFWAIVAIVLLFAGSTFAGSVMLAWDPPTTRVDGSPLTNLAGYELYWGTSSGEYTDSITVTFCNACPSPVSSIVEWECLPLQPNTLYYLAVTAFDEAGEESGYSNEVYLTSPPPTKPLGNCATTPVSTQCRVDGYDIIFINKQLGKTILGLACTQANYTVWKTIEKADLNYDGIIDGRDKAIVSADFGQSCSSCPCP